MRPLARYEPFAQRCVGSGVAGLLRAVRDDLQLAHVHRLCKLLKEKKRKEVEESRRNGASSTSATALPYAGCHPWEPSNGIKQLLQNCVICQSYVPTQAPLTKISSMPAML